MRLPSRQRAPTWSFSFVSCHPLEWLWANVLWRPSDHLLRGGGVDRTLVGQACIELRQPPGQNSHTHSSHHTTHLLREHCTNHHILIFASSSLHYCLRQLDRCQLESYNRLYPERPTSLFAIVSSPLDTSDPSLAVYEESRLAYRGCAPSRRQQPPAHIINTAGSILQPPDRGLTPLKESLQSEWDW